ATASSTTFTTTTYYRSKPLCSVSSRCSKSKLKTKAMAAAAAATSPASVSISTNGSSLLAKNGGQASVVRNGSHSNLNICTSGGGDSKQTDTSTGDLSDSSDDLHYFTLPVLKRAKSMESLAASCNSSSSSSAAIGSLHSTIASGRSITARFGQQHSARQMEQQQISATNCSAVAAASTAFTSSSSIKNCNNSTQSHATIINSFASSHTV